MAPGATRSPVVPARSPDNTKSNWGRGARMADSGLIRRRARIGVLTSVSSGAGSGAGLGSGCLGAGKTDYIIGAGFVFVLNALN